MVAALSLSSAWLGLLALPGGALPPLPRWMDAPRCTLPVLAAEDTPTTSTAASAAPAAPGGRRQRASLLALEAAKADDWESAVGFLESLRASEPLDPCYSATIAACGRARQWELAIRLLSEYRQRRPAGSSNPVVFNAAIGACGRAAQYVSAEKIFRQMLASGQPPDAFSYNSLIQAARTADRWTDALKSLQAMRDRGLEPTSMSYSTAISACRRAYQGKPAAALVRTMISEGIEPGERDLTNALSATAASAALVDGLEMWKLLREQAGEDGTSPRAFTAAISLRAAAGQWREAISLLEELEGGGGADLCALNAALRACGRGKAEVVHAERIWARIDAAALQPDTYSYHAMVVAMGGKGGGATRACELIESAHKGALALPTRTYGAALNVCATDAAWEQALALLTQMRERGVHVDEGCWGAAVSACHAAGKWDKVHELLYEMRGALGMERALKPWQEGMFKQAKQKLGLPTSVSVSVKSK